MIKKVLKSIIWVFYTLGTLLVAGLYIPYLLYLEWRGLRRRREEVAWSFARWWGRAVLAATGSRVTVRGKENVPPGPVVVMGNHQSCFDIMLVLGYIDKPLAFIAKKELARLPLISQWMKFFGCLFLDRRDVRQAAQVFQRAVEAVRNGWSMVIFPEGTRSRSAEMREFKKGSMKLPVRANVPIVPISIDGTYKVYEGNGSMIGSADITLTISPPILPKDYAGMGTAQLAQMVQQKVAGKLTAPVKV